MYAALVQYLESVDEATLPYVDLEEIALIQALHDSYPPQSELRQRLVFVPRVVKNWLRYDYDELTPAFNMRLQPLLRNAVDAFIERGVNGVQPGQLALLKATHETLEQIRDKDDEDRLLKMLRRDQEEIEYAYSTAPPPEGLPELFDAIAFTTEKLINASPRTSVKTFGGIDLALSGPTFRHSGDLKVLDSVPADSMVVVEKGSCYVNGYAMGHIAADEECNVRENIGGTVITGRGSIQARNILTRAYVVAKWSDVVVENSLDPQLVYAGNEIDIKENARLGTYVAPNITVGGTVQAGQFTFSESCHARTFAPLDMRKLVLEMQEKITSEAYGGVVDPEAGRTVAKINRTRARHEHVQRSIKVLHNEIEHFASNAIMYLLGGDLVQKHLEEISRKQRRVAFLDRIINGIDGISDSQRRSRGSGRTSGGIDEISDELAGMNNDPDVDADLANEGRELHSMSEAVSRSERIESSALSKLSKKKAAWGRERDKEMEELKALQAMVQKSLGDTEAATTAQRTAGQLKMLDQMMKNVRRKSTTDPVLKRSRSNFILFMQRSIEQRKGHILKYKKLLDKLAKEHAELSERLKNKHQMQVPDETEGPELIVTGEFEADVALCTDKSLVEQGVSGNKDVVFTDDRPGVRTFVLQDQQIIEKS